MTLSRPLGPGLELNTWHGLARAGSPTAFKTGELVVYSPTLAPTQKSEPRHVADMRLPAPRRQPEGMPAADESRRTNRVTLAHEGELLRAVVLGALLLAATFVALFMVYVLRELVAATLLGIVLGMTLMPAADRLAELRVPRLLTGMLIYGLIAAAVSAFFWLAIPQLIEEGRSLGDAWDDLERDYNDFAAGSFLPDSEAVAQFASDNFAGLGASTVGQAFAILNGFVLLLTILAVGLFWTMTGHRAYDLFISLLSPRQQRSAIPLLETLGKRLRRFLLAEFLGMLAVGAMVYVGLTILGVPFALILAIFAFLFEILPFAGPWIAFLPAFAVALTEGWGTAIAVSVLYLVIQQVESYLIVPFLQRRETRTPELVIFVAVLAGTTLMGILGALVAIPVAVIVYTLFMELFVPWRRERIAEAAAPRPADEEPAEPGDPDRVARAAGIRRLHDR